MFDADALEDRDQNRRPLIEEQQVPRGSITSADGVLIAESQARGRRQPHPVYVRDYPQGSLFGNPVGYNFVTSAGPGSSAPRTTCSSGEKNEFASIIDQLANTHSPRAPTSR